MIWEDPPFRLDEIPTFSRVFLKESGPKCHQVPTKIRTFWFWSTSRKKTGFQTFKVWNNIDPTIIISSLNRKIKHKENFGKA